IDTSGMCARLVLECGWRQASEAVHPKGVTMSRPLHPIAWLSVSVLLAALLCVRSALAQSLLDGYWIALYDEDYIERDPGPDQGEYAGLPVTPAAISVGRSWDPESLTLPELQ